VIEAFTSLAFARPEMRALSEELGLAATAAALVDDKIVLLERTGPQSDLDRMIQVGQRYPYTPPSGLVLAAWLPDDEIRKWLADYPDVAMDTSIEHVRGLVDSARQLGYIVEKMSDVSLGALTHTVRPLDISLEVLL